jgi:hypothetical protein
MATGAVLSGWQGLVLLLQAILATPPYAVVLADAQPAALLAGVSLAVVLADARPRIGIFGKSQPAKNRNLSRLISHLSRLNWSSQRNSVYCFPTVFTRLQQQEVPG